MKGINFNPSVMLTGFIFTMLGIIGALLGDYKVAVIGAMTCCVGGILIAMAIEWPMPVVNAKGFLPIPEPVSGWMGLRKAPPESTEDEALPNPAYRKNVSPALKVRGPGIGGDVGDAPLPAAPKRALRPVPEPEPEPEDVEIVIEAEPVEEPEAPLPKGTGKGIPDAEAEFYPEPKGKTRLKRKR